MLQVLLNDLNDRILSGKFSSSHSCSDSWYAPDSGFAECRDVQGLGFVAFRVFKVWGLTRVVKRGSPAVLAKVKGFRLVPFRLCPKRFPLMYSQYGVFRDLEALNPDPKP